MILLFILMKYEDYIRFRFAQTDKFVDLTQYSFGTIYHDIIEIRLMEKLDNNNIVSNIAIRAILQY